jgi:hypothetical protein
MVERAQANADGVSAAPEAFVVLTIIAFAIPCLVLRQSYQEHLAALEGKLATQQALLADYRSRLRGASTGEAAAQSEEPRASAGTRARGKDRDDRTRDPQRLYAGDLPVALVAAAPVNSDDKTVTFPEITARGLLAMDQPYEYKNWKLSCGGVQSYSVLGAGAAREFSYSHLICKIVGDR